MNSGSFHVLWKSCRNISAGLCTKSLHIGFLCAASVFSVSLWCVFARNSSTTESQRTQRLHRDCLLYTSDAADERSSVDLGGRRIIKKKKKKKRYQSNKMILSLSIFIFFFFSSRRRHTRFLPVSWARRCV